MGILTRAGLIDRRSKAVRDADKDAAFKAYEAAETAVAEVDTRVTEHQAELEKLKLAGGEIAARGGSDAEWEKAHAAIQAAESHGRRLELERRAKVWALDEARQTLHRVVIADRRKALERNNGYRLEHADAIAKAVAELGRAYRLLLGINDRARGVIPYDTLVRSGGGFLLDPNELFQAVARELHRVNPQLPGAQEYAGSWADVAAGNVVPLVEEMKRANDGILALLDKAPAPEMSPVEPAPEPVTAAPAPLPAGMPVPDTQAGAARVTLATAGRTYTAAEAQALHTSGVGRKRTLGIE